MYLLNVDDNLTLLIEIPLVILLTPHHLYPFYGFSSLISLPHQQPENLRYDTISKPLLPLLNMLFH